jgi:hypothetical protein
MEEGGVVLRRAPSALCPNGGEEYYCVGVPFDPDLPQQFPPRGRIHDEEKYEQEVERGSSDRTWAKILSSESSDSSSFFIFIKDSSDDDSFFYKIHDTTSFFT